MFSFAEGPNPSRRSAKVYGRRKVLPETRESHRLLFGLDEKDENAIEKSLAQLSLRETYKEHAKLIDRPRSPLKVIGESLKHRQSPLKSPKKSPVKAFQVPVVETPWRPPPTQTLFATTKCTTSKRDRPKFAAPSLPLTDTERQQLEPLLSLPNVHSSVVSFVDFAERILSKFDVSKSGEGSFSECLLLKSRISPTDSAVLKIIPFDLSALSPNSKASVKVAPVLISVQACCNTSPSSSITNSTISAVAREVSILSALSSHHGFTSLRSRHVVRGSWHSGFLDAYHAFRQAYPDLAVNPLPSQRWNDDMIYGVIEMDNAGAELEGLLRPSAFQVYDVFWQTVMLLGFVEEGLEFEHRDLHMSNICYKERIVGNGFDIDAGMLKSKAEPEEVLGLSNLKVTIIDYTMSRVKASVGKESGEERVLFNPESAWSEVEQELNEDCTEIENHQALTGRRMRDLAIRKHAANSAGANENKWAQHLPQTNIIWLAHLLYELLQQAGARPKHLSGSSSAMKKVQTRIWRQLRDVLALLDRDEPEVATIADLLHLALEKEWVRQAGIDAFKKRLNDEV